MADPITLTVVGGALLTEGVKFFYGQVSKILERRAARKEAARKEQAELAKAELANVQLPEAFQGQLSAPKIDFDEVERLHRPLLELRGRLANYGDGFESVDPNDKELLLDIEKLRLMLESIYGQRITFKGEDREQSGTRVITKIKIGEVLGKATVTRIGELESGVVETEAVVDKVGDTGEFIAADIGKMTDKR